VIHSFPPRRAALEDKTNNSNSRTNCQVATIVSPATGTTTDTTTIATNAIHSSTNIPRAKRVKKECRIPTPQSRLEMTPLFSSVSVLGSPPPPPASSHSHSHSRSHSRSPTIITITPSQLETESQATDTSTEEMDGYTNQISFPQMMKRDNNNNKHSSSSLSQSFSNNWTFDMPMPSPTTSPDFFDTSTIQMAEFLGSGHFGSVFLAQHRWSARRYCIKSIEKERARDENALSLIHREVAIHSRLSHENIVAFLGLFQDDENVCMALEVCQGDLFRMKLQPQSENEYSPPMSLKEASWYIRQVLCALSYLHYNSVYHRDIKPENILMYNGDKFATIKLCDFGYSIHAKANADSDANSNANANANANRSDTWRNTFCGTKEYIPLEVRLI